MISLITFAWGKFSEYQASKVELANIKNTAKFNEQFTNYDRNDVQGYEILTLIHKVVDYNERNTEESKIKADSYPKIALTINMTTGSDFEYLRYGDRNYLFAQQIYGADQFSSKDGSKKGSFVDAIETKINTAITESGR